MGKLKAFCAEESLRAGDPLAGTATHAERNLLLSWPRRYWTRNLRHANNMSSHLIEKLDDVAEGGRRVNLIYRRRESEDSHHVLLFPESLAFDILPEHLVAFLEDVRQANPLDNWCGHSINQPVMLCCTHGKKDKCCARFGYATYRQLQTEIDHRELPVDLWESSHLGGCRLAASLITFPSRRKYGRIGTEDTLPLLQSEIQNRAYLPCYRGNGSLTPAQQCAEAAGLQWLEERYVSGAAQSIEVGKEREEDKAIRVQLKWTADKAQGILEVRCIQQEILRVDTCADLEEGPTTSWCWVVADIVSDHHP